MPCLVEKGKPLILRGKPRNPAVGPVGEWIDENMDRQGWTVRLLAEKAGVSGPRITQLRQGDGTTRDMITRIAVAFSQEGDELVGQHILKTGLTAAGLLPDSNHEYNEHEIIDYLRGKPDFMQDKALRMLKAAFDEEDAADNAGNVGKKAK